MIWVLSIGAGWLTASLLLTLGWVLIRRQDKEYARLLLTGDYIESTIEDMEEALR